MNAKQKLHQSKLESWTLLIQAQAESGLTVKEWCAQNNLTIHAYNYWKHQLKEAYVDCCMPDIVQVPASAETSTAVSGGQSSGVLCESRESRNSRNLCDTQAVRISTADVDISFSSAASDDMILRVLKAVRHA